MADNQSAATATPAPLSLPASVDETHELLANGRYVADRSLATVLYLALKRQRPLFLEGEAGVGKTEIAKVLAEVLGRRLLRLQCYEGLDASSAVYEWNYPRQMVEIRIAEAAGDRDRETLATDIFDEKFLIERPMLQALRPGLEGAPVLLIDELDRADEPFEAYLLEILSDYQITIPELGTIAAPEPPIVIVTSNRTREIHDALKRRCFYHWLDYPSAARELEILRIKAPGAPEQLSREEQREVDQLKQRDAEVRAHEQAHSAAGGRYAGAASYSYTTGPDDRRYATSGEVPIDVSKVPDNPSATIAKMQVVKRAALAPANPSGADRAIHASASRSEQQARAEFREEKAEELAGQGADEADTPVDGPASEPSPSPESATTEALLAG